METLMVALEMLRRLWQKLGPYLVIELLLPGGSLIALALFVYRRSRYAPVPAGALFRRAVPIDALERIRR